MIMWWTPAPSSNNTAVRFVTWPAMNLALRSNGGGTGTALPPSKPPTLPGFGDYCFRATCRVSSGGEDVGFAKGYDTDLSVADNTERACRLEARTMNSRGRTFTCSAAEVVMLPNAPNECSGQVFFSIGTSTKRLLA